MWNNQRKQVKNEERVGFMEVEDENVTYDEEEEWGDEEEEYVRLKEKDDEVEWHISRWLGLKKPHKH